MQIGIEYYQCLGISLFSILLVSFGYYWTNKQNMPLQYITLVIIPLMIYAWFIFTNLEFTIMQRVVSIPAIFIILFYVVALLGWLVLLAVCIILGYFSWSLFPVFINVSIFIVFILIINHFIVDNRKARGWKYVYVPSHPYYSGDMNQYPGASVIPLGFALSASIGFTSWLLMKSVIFSLIWIGFGVICYYLIRQIFFYWDKNYKLYLHKYLWGKVSDDDKYSAPFDVWDKRSRKKAILYYTRDMRKYLSYILIAIGIAAILPLLLLIFNHITH